MKIGERDARAPGSYLRGRFGIAEMSHVEVQPQPDEIDDLGDARRGKVFSILGQLEQLDFGQHMREAANGQTLSHRHSSEQRHETVHRGDHGRVVGHHVHRPRPAVMP